MNVHTLNVKGKSRKIKKLYFVRGLANSVDTKKVPSCTWNIRFPVLTSYIIPSYITATHTCL